MVHLSSEIYSLTKVSAKSGQDHFSPESKALGIMLAGQDFRYVLAHPAQWAL
jgi:hypothetical protein